MLHKLCKPTILALGACLCLLAVACTAAGGGQVLQPQAASPKIANPAAQKCLEDGYELEPVLAADGLPVDHLCVDKKSGKRCEVWDYFREECRLRGEEPQR